MKTSRSALPVLFLLIILGLAASTAPAGPPAPAASPPSPATAVTDSLNLFSLDLYRSLAGTPGNLILSPASVYLGLAQVMAGARGQTEKELRDTLHITLPNEAFHPAFGALYDNIVSRGGRDYQLKWASRFWVRDDFKVKEPYSDLLRSAYHAAPGRFNSPKVADEINRWVSNQTEREIRQVVGEDDVARADLILANAIFFHGKWLAPFPNYATSPSPFHLQAGSTVQTPMMGLSTTCPAGRGEGFAFITLPYRGDCPAMTILLPDKKDGLPALEKSLEWSRLSGLLVSVPDRRVEIRLPKFNFENRADLTKTLAATIPSAFGPGSDLSGIANLPPGIYLYISKVLHVAKVEVNEEGTKASAATVIMAVAGGVMIEREEPIQFIADHPFLFLIHDTRTGAILFIGRVTDPREN